MFRRRCFGGMLAPLVVGGLVFAFAKHAHRRAHMMHCAEAEAGGEKPFGRAHFYGHLAEVLPKWRHFKHMHHGCFEDAPGQAANQPAAEAVDDQQSA